MPARHGPGRELLVGLARLHARTEQLSAARSSVNGEQGETTHTAHVSDGTAAELPMSAAGRPGRQSRRPEQTAATVQDGGPT